MDNRISVVIISGFLGSGKTSLINNLLSKINNKKIAIIENEFSEFGIDKTLIKKSQENIFELNNGCICCNMKGELEGILGDISKNEEKYDYLIIESTGIADPSPIVNLFFGNPLVREYFRLDSLIAIIDSKYFLEQISKNFVVKKQVAFADKIILNKLDLVETEKLNKIKIEIQKRNPTAKLFETTYSNIDFKNFFEEYSFDLSKISNFEKSINSFIFKSADIKNEKKHTEEIQSFGIKFNEAISLPKFDFFLRTLIEFKSKDIYRMKGIINIKDLNQALIFQGVHENIDYLPGRPWEDNEIRESKMIFIGKNLNELDLKNSIDKLIKIKE